MSQSPKKRDWELTGAKGIGAKEEETSVKEKPRFKGCL